MRVPLSWLREFVDVDLTGDELAERLTLLGMEVQHVERWGADWSAVVVGELLAVERHPRADRLSLTRVTLGQGEPLEIVCGATNIAPGQRIPVALPGTVLPGNRRIERVEKMGVVSNGMLCSGDELRLTGDADGILILPDDAPLGRPLVDLFGDVVLDIDVKPNRGDALSIHGLAREVAAAIGEPLRDPAIAVEEGSGPGTAERLAVDVRDRGLCPRFVGRWVEGVTVGPSPDRIQMRLLAAGMRPISNVVDASNYVMLELGKPIHAFDAARVAIGEDGRRSIVVRRAEPGERLETLDHVPRELTDETLLIADPRGPLAIAGVMGGADSEVSETTRAVVVESAVFDPVSIRRTAQRFGLRSEASSRFEKGQEIRLARLGADRTAQLIREWAGGEIASGRVDTDPREPEPLRVPFRPMRINRLLGLHLEAADQRELLLRVGIETEDTIPGEAVTVAAAPDPLVAEPLPATAYTALVPTWRRDIAIEADVAEEIARLHGYDATPSVTPDTPMPIFRPSPLEVREVVRESLAGAGVTEVVTTALVSPRHLDAFRLVHPVASVGDDPPPAGRVVQVTNPLSRDHSVLRQDLVPSLLDVLATNLRHGTDDVAIFEIGKGYGATEAGPREWWRLALVLHGAAEEPAWNRVARPFDLDDAKGLVELLCRRLGLDRPGYVPEANEPALHPGRAARVSSGASLRGILAELHPARIEAWHLRTTARVVIGELAILGLGGGRLLAEQAPVIARFPSVERDLAIIVPEARPATDVESSIRSHGGELLHAVRLFDIYRGTPLGPEEKSLAYRLAFQAPDRTLTEDEVDAAIESVTRGVAALGGRLRT